MGQERRGEKGEGHETKAQRKRRGMRSEDGQRTQRKPPGRSPTQAGINQLIHSTTAKCTKRGKHRAKKERKRHQTIFYILCYYHRRRGVGRPGRGGGGGATVKKPKIFAYVKKKDVQENRLRKHKNNFHAKVSVKKHCVCGLPFLVVSFRPQQKRQTQHKLFFASALGWGDAFGGPPPS